MLAGKVLVVVLVVVIAKLLGSTVVAA